MKIVLLQNTIVDGKRMLAGEVADVSEAFALHMAEQDLAYFFEEPGEKPAQEVEPVKKPVRRRRTTKVVEK